MWSLGCIGWVQWESTIKCRQVIGTKTKMGAIAPPPNLARAVMIVKQCMPGNKPNCPTFICKMFCKPPFRMQSSHPPSLWMGLTPCRKGSTIKKPMQRTGGSSPKPILADGIPRREDRTNGALELQFHRGASDNGAGTIQHSANTYIEGLRKDDGDGGSHFASQELFMCWKKLNGRRGDQTSSRYSKYIYMNSLYVSLFNRRSAGDQTSGDESDGGNEYAKGRSWKI